MDDLDIEDNVSSIPQELTSFATKDYTESQPTESGSSESFEEIVHYDSSSMREMKHIILTEPSNMDARPDKRNNIRNYLEMVREKDDFKCKPEWDSCQKSIDMDVIKTSNNFKFVSKLLEMKSQMRIDMRDKRNVEINDLMNDQRYFGHLFEVFDKFVKENIEKRERAIDKIKSERALRAELDQEIIKVVSGAQRLAKLRLDIRQEINRNKMFVDFLETVRELAPNHFRNGVTDIIDRYQFGKLLQQLLCTVAYTEVSGSSYVEWDAVNIVSDFMAFCLEDPKVLETVSGHYSNCEKLPVTNMKDVSAHMAGTALCSELYKSVLDLKLYSEKKFWPDIVKEVWPQHFVFPLDERRNQEPVNMTEIVTEYWAAAYFSHVWSKMIAADIYTAFQDENADEVAVGSRFRDTYLAFGGSCDPHEVFRRFRGRDPNPDSFIRYLRLRK